jgi:C_GCAxxG_C_C family probable redox protein
MTRADDAAATFGRGFNCAQSVLSACCEPYGMSKEQALNVSCAFGAGMGRQGATCGAVTGAYMAIGLKYGKYLEGDEAPKEKTYALVNEFNRQFAARNGTVVCKELLGLEIGTPEGAKIFKEWVPRKPLHEVRAGRNGNRRGAAEEVTGCGHEYYACHISFFRAIITLT